jgi:Ran-binding protein 9/10
LSILLIYSNLGIGFSLASVELNREPGWDVGAWGYHGDDGNAFHNGLNDKYGPTFSTVSVT